MQDINNAGSAPIATPTTPTPAKKPGARGKRSDAAPDAAPSRSIIHYIEEKEWIQAVKDEFDLKNDSEASRLVCDVAKAYRYDDNGNDRFAAIANEIAANRHIEQARDELTKKLASLQSLAAKAGLTSDQLEAMKAQFIA